MKQSLQQHIAIAVHITILAIVLCVGAFVSYYSKKNTEASITSLAHEYEKRMYTLSEITDRNGVDDEIGEIIKNCPRQNDFESYLIRLSTLSKQELIEMQSLFDVCGITVSEQKSLMVAKLNRELESYIEILTLLEKFDKTHIFAVRQSQFSSLVQIEKERSAFIYEQVTIQQKIITLLISGYTAQSAEVSVLLSEAQHITKLLDESNQRADEIRTQITL